MHIYGWSVTFADGIGCGKAIHQGFFSLLATCSVQDQLGSLLVKWLYRGRGWGAVICFMHMGFSKLIYKQNHLKASLKGKIWFCG